MTETERKAAALAGLHERLDRHDELLAKILALLEQALAPRARPPRWSSKDSPRLAELERRVRAIVAEDTLPGLVDDAVGQFLGRDPAVVASGVAHVLLMRARGRHVESPSRMLGWATTVAKPGRLEEGASDDLEAVDRLIELEHAGRVPAPPAPSSRETRRVPAGEAPPPPARAVIAAKIRPGESSFESERILRLARARVRAELSPDDAATLEQLAQDLVEKRRVTTFARGLALASARDEVLDTLVDGGRGRIEQVAREIAAEDAAAGRA